MNRCRQIVGSNWTSGLIVVFRPPTNCRWCPEAAPSLRRSLATATQQAPGSDTGDKPRLRAVDLARKVQKEKTKPRSTEAPVSTLQRRVTELKQFSQQLQNVHPNVLAKHLHKAILYQDKDVVVINKPYGVPVRDDSGVTSVSSVLPVLSKMMDGMKIKSSFQLFPCLGLEKDKSGALLLARSKEAAEHINVLNRNHQVQRKYWVITVGIPVPSEGLIDIPIIEKEVMGPQPHFKMALSPLFRINDAGDGVSKVRSSRQAHPAATKYRVLDSSSGCSLVELQPLTGVKHQIRVHMAYALTCPILGDHKYSHWNKLAPQQLPERTLKKLGLENTKSRHLPLHVVSRQLVLSGMNEADIRVSCPLPKYFTQTLRRLKLILPEKKDLE